MVPFGLFHITCCLFRTYLSIYLVIRTELSHVPQRTRLASASMIERTLKDSRNKIKN